MELSNLLDKEFKVMVIKISPNLGEEWMNAVRTFTRRQYQTEVTELKNRTTELKNTPEGFSSRLDEAEESIGDLEDRAVELTQTEQQKEKRIFKSEGELRDL